MRVRAKGPVWKLLREPKGIDEILELIGDKAVEEIDEEFERQLASITDEEWEDMSHTDSEYASFELSRTFPLTQNAS